MRVAQHVDEHGEQLVLFDRQRCVDLDRGEERDPVVSLACTHAHRLRNQGFGANRLDRTPRRIVHVLSVGEVLDVIDALGEIVDLLLRCFALGPKAARERPEEHRQLPPLLVGRDPLGEIVLVRIEQRAGAIEIRNALAARVAPQQSEAPLHRL